MAERDIPVIEHVVVAEDTLAVELSDGRTISVPLAWFPRLTLATPDEREHWRLIGNGRGIHWDAVDEDVSVECLLAGKASDESSASLQKWLESRGHAVSAY